MKVKLLLIISFIFSPSLYSFSDHQIRSVEEALVKRLKWKEFVISRMESLGVRHQKDSWNIPDGQSPNKKYKDGFEYTREYYIDNKDRHNLELAYLKRAIEKNFYLGQNFLLFIEKSHKLNAAELLKQYRETRKRQIKSCANSSTRLVIQASLDALPLLAGIQAEIYDRIVDRNFHSPESGLAGIAGGVLGSFIESMIHLFYLAKHKKKEEFDGGLWAVTQLVWDESFGVNSECFIQTRKLEVLNVLRYRGN